jgi:hypothetical protein
VEITTDDSEAAVHCGSTIVSVKCIILSMIEGTNDERRRETLFSPTLLAANPHDEGVASR